MPSPSPMNRHRERSASLPCASLGYQVRGTPMVRPSTQSTINESSVSRTRCARASPISVGDAEVFMPLLHKAFLIDNHQPLDVPEFRRRETAASGQSHRIEPELGAIGVALDMDVNRF